ncbi:MAG: hypothetical protein ACLGG3_03930, partial [Alphaproteobacteria bacterium]
SWTLKRVQGDGFATSSALSGEAEARRAGRWGRALARYRAAEAALASVEGTGDDARYDRVLVRFNHALRALLRTPAPGADALAAKLELAQAHLAWEMTGGEACMAALARDARRLAG